jgi:dolichyl-phosphate beta-glucosyltransferase
VGEVPTITVVTAPPTPTDPTAPDLSIVIPAYNEAHKIARDVEAAGRFLVEQNLTGEVIVSDDGSRDDTAGTARACSVPAPLVLKVIEQATNRGKGAAVRAGMAASTGRYAMFADSGVCIPYDQALRGLELLKSGQCEIAHASRKRADSIIVNPQPLHRRMFSRAFRLAVDVYLGLPYRLSDTQCGFKLYRGDVARQLYGACQTEGFLFDLEIIIRAGKAGLRIAEFPVTWSCDPDSRLRAGRTTVRTIHELKGIKRTVR